jgi:uncharacterized protein YdbL (DUF1318 family)
MKLIRIFTTLIVILFSTQLANALDLATAKEKGLVGEKSTGYIGAVKSNDEVNALVKEINAKRKEAYKQISNENGQPVDVVEALAAKKLYEKLKESEYYKSGDGDWKQK